MTSTDPMLLEVSVHICRVRVCLWGEVTSYSDLVLLLLLTTQSMLCMLSWSDSIAEMHLLLLLQVQFGGSNMALHN